MTTLSEAIALWSGFRANMFGTVEDMQEALNNADRIIRQQQRMIEKANYHLERIGRYEINADVKDHLNGAQKSLSPDVELTEE